MDETFETVVLGGQEQRDDADSALGGQEQGKDADLADDVDSDVETDEFDDADIDDDDSDDDDEDESDDSDDDKKDKDVKDGKEKRDLTPEERHRNAAMRREKERAQSQAAIDAEKKAAQERVDKAYADAYAGQVNPYTGKPITSEADYLAYKEAFEKDRIEQEMKKAGLSVDAINKIVDNHPVVKQAHSVIKQAEESAAAAKQVQAQEGINNELKIISALNPSIKTLEDLTTMENAEEYFNLVKRGGLTLSEAFKLLNFDNLTSRKTAAAKQAAINQVTGKGHLSVTQSRGAGGVAIPPETLTMYKELFPNKTEADFQKHYATHNK